MGHISIIHEYFATTLIIFTADLELWRFEPPWDTVGVQSAKGHAFWFAYAALAFMALGGLISTYRADAQRELPLTFTLPWLALNGLGCYVFPTSGFSSVVCNAAYLVYLSP